jgi:hypothetical protein
MPPACVVLVPHVFRQLPVHQGQLVAGDRQQPLGEFSSTLEILDSGTTVEASHAARAGCPGGR